MSTLARPAAVIRRARWSALWRLTLSAIVAVVGVAELIEASWWGPFAILGALALARAAYLEHREGRL